MRPLFPAAASATRRRFLQRLGGGFGAVALEGMMRQQAQASAAATVGHRAAVDALAPFAPRVPDFQPRAKSVIFLFMVGGPSPVDTFDYKPTLQKLHGRPLPDSIRKSLDSGKYANVTHGCKDELLGSPYAWKQHGQSGMWVSELFPRVAEQVDQLCFIHSMQSDSNNHAPSSYQLHTGDIRAGKASLGSWTTYGLGTLNQNLPGYVVLYDAGPLGGAANYSNGFLPAAYQATRLRDQGTPVMDLLPPEEFAPGQRASLDLLQTLNMEHRRSREGLSDLDARMASYELAYRMQSAALEVGEVERERDFLKRDYGLEHEDERTRSFGRKCLLARRLVQRGVRFVQVYDMPDKDGWDAHAKLTENHTPRARWTDQPVAALLKDLKESGLLEETLVVWAGEFGRTPLMQGDFGRNHNSAGFTVWMAGGGVKAGQRIGATDEVGYEAVERPIPVHDLHATILHALGLDHSSLFFDANGRQERLTGVAGQANIIPEVFA